MAGLRAAERRGSARAAGRRIAGSSLPIAEAASQVFGARGATAVTLIAIWSPLTMMSATLLCLTRILYAMGSDGLLPAALGRADRLGHAGRRAGVLDG